MVVMLLVFKKTDYLSLGELQHSSDTYFQIVTKINGIQILQSNTNILSARALNLIIDTEIWLQWRW